MAADQGPYSAQNPVQFAVEYPDRPLNRLTSFFRIFVIIPISIVLGAAYFCLNKIISSGPKNSRPPAPAGP